MVVVVSRLVVEVTGVVVVEVTGVVELVVIMGVRVVVLLVIEDAEVALDVSVGVGTELLVSSESHIPLSLLSRQQPSPRLR